MSKYKKRNQRKNQRNIIIISVICLTFTLITAYSAFSTTLNINAKGNVIDKSRTIQNYSKTSTEDFHQNIYKENIVTATFLNSAKVPENAIEFWDVSVSKDKGVMAYITESTEETGKYDLFIGAKDGVIANNDSSYLFFAFPNLKKIEFNNNFDTSNTIFMDSMFAGGNKITSLDISSFNTDNVKSMVGIFTAWNTNEQVWKEGTMTEIIGLEKINTNNVEDMQDMFSGQAFTHLNLSNFNTSKVTSMPHMFINCTNLIEINLCSFDTNNVTTMNQIFASTPNLTKVKVGPNWTIAKVTNTTDMFTNSGISQVTTGEC